MARRCHAMLVERRGCQCSKGREVDDFERAARRDRIAEQRGACVDDGRRRFDSHAVAEAPVDGPLRAMSIATISPRATASSICTCIILAQQTLPAMRREHGDLRDRGHRHGSTTRNRELDADRAGRAAQRAVDEGAEATLEVALVELTEEVDRVVVHVAAHVECGAHAAQVVADLGVGDRSDLDVSHRLRSTPGGGLRTARSTLQWRR